jgi:2-polyprenyl-3-methyl-5-hydroxy-6-metoxy-1,4-benzoquinol methylase
MRWNAEDSYVADSATQDARAARQLEQLPKAHEKGRLLDFGAGVGTFAATAQAAGWAVEGVEVNETATRRARDAFGLELRLEPTEGPFDVITMWDVVEHLRSPETVIRQLAARLAPAGLMLFETGNWECWQRVALGRKWGLYLFDHQTYFSPASLAKLVARAGMPRFTLADSGHRKPSARSWVRPLSAARKRRAFRRAAKWGPHGDIEVMFCAAARDE